MSLIEDDDVIKILKILDESEFEELDLEIGDFKLSVRKSSSGGRQPIQNQAVVSTRAEVIPQNIVDIATEEKTVKTQTLSSQPKDILSPNCPDRPALAEDEGLIPIKAPLMGVFYRSPKPEAPPYVEVGSHVRKKDAVCLIEVMKTFTSVAAGVDGVVVKICVESSQLVEYEQILFLIKPGNNTYIGAGK